ncbi:hypothetical protein HK097_003184, partial [Rhizophlyctis rosea]
MDGAQPALDPPRTTTTPAVPVPTDCPDCTPARNVGCYKINEGLVSPLGADNYMTVGQCYGICRQHSDLGITYFTLTSNLNNGLISCACATTTTAQAFTRTDDTYCESICRDGFKCGSAHNNFWNVYA